jgi:hypothetical protein
VRGRLVAATAIAMVLFAGSAHAQTRTPPRRGARTQEFMRISVNGGLQTTTGTFEDTQTFDQYFETGSFTLTNTVPKLPFFDAGVAVRVYRRLHAGMTVSFIDSTDTGSVTGDVPHPLLFNQKRTVTGDVVNIHRRETAEHFQASWTAPAAAGLEFSAFGGPSIFNTEQTYVTALTLGLDKEVYPYDTFAFAGATTATFNEIIIGYNIGVDMTWRFSKHVGLGLLFRYAHGEKTFTPAGGAPFKVEAGGLHAGGGLRVIL